MNLVARSETIRLPTVRKMPLNYLVPSSCFKAPPSGDQINLDTSDAGRSGRNSLEDLMLTDSLVRPIIFVYVPLITFMTVHVSLAPIPFN
jgi:hypothetical protein